MRESKYQRELVKKIEALLPGCIVKRNDPAQEQGVPDLTILYKGRWGMLEVKESASAPIQPNQRYLVDRYNKMSFAAFIHPGIEARVLNELQRSLTSRR